MAADPARRGSCGRPKQKSVVPSELTVGEVQIRTGPYCKSQNCSWGVNIKQRSLPASEWDVEAPKLSVGQDLDIQMVGSGVRRYCGDNHDRTASERGGEMISRRTGRISKSHFFKPFCTVSPQNQDEHSGAGTITVIADDRQPPFGSAL